MLMKGVICFRLLFINDRFRIIREKLLLINNNYTAFHYCLYEYFVDLRNIRSLIIFIHL